jgi:hypothetical protein
MRSLGIVLLTIAATLIGLAWLTQGVDPATKLIGAGCVAGIVLLALTSGPRGAAAVR